MQEYISYINTSRSNELFIRLLASQRDMFGEQLHLDGIKTVAIDCDTKPTGPNHTETLGIFSVDRREVRGMEFAQRRDLQRCEIVIVRVPNVL